MRALSYVLQPWSGEASTEPEYIEDAKFCFWKNNKRMIIIQSRFGFQPTFVAGDYKG